MTDKITAHVNPRQRIVTTVAPQSLVNINGANRLVDMLDVDETNTINGSLLVFKTSSSKWTSTTTLDAQNMDGGEY